MNDKKICVYCKLEKSLDEFTDDKRATDGKQSRCKNCCRNWDKKKRIEVIEHYGGKCAWCGETDISKLEIDHINGDAAEDKKLYGKHIGKSLARFVIKMGFPENKFQILCKRCNWAKGQGTEADFDEWAIRLYQNKLLPKLQAEL